MVEYTEDKKVAYCKEYRFVRDEKTGYYLSTRKTDRGRRERLHVFVWRMVNGEIPEGSNIHHIDEDKGNNEPDNLMCLSSGEHKSLHTREMMKTNRKAALERLDKHARPKAVAWHKSEEGRAWHREHGFVKVKKDFVCEQCGKHYKALNTGHNHFCSNKCRAAARRASGVDNETRTCEVCGKKFITNKYSKARTCSRPCSHVIAR